MPDLYSKSVGADYAVESITIKLSYHHPDIIVKTYLPKLITMEDLSTS